VCNQGAGCGDFSIYRTKVTLAGNNIKYSITSVYELSFKNFELIVINDNSSDNSLDILTCLAETYGTLRVINQPDKGVGPARNTGLQVARGEFIAFLDADGGESLFFRKHLFA
jgi:glycosyltransferase involved in cell wall biosynthesis